MMLKTDINTRVCVFDLYSYIITINNTKFILNVLSMSGYASVGSSSIKVATIIYES